MKAAAKFLYVPALAVGLALSAAAAPLHATENIKETVLAQTVQSASSIQVKINGVSPYFTYAPFLQNDSTMIPARAVMENLGCTVGWEGETKTVKISANGKTITLTIGQSEITVDGVKKNIPAPAVLVGDVTYIPLRAVSDALGATVGWDADSRTAGICSYEKTHTLSVGSTTLTLGQTAQSFFASCGLPSYSYLGENGLVWHVYADSPASFFAAASDGGILCAYYTNAPGFYTSDGYAYGSTAPSNGKQYEYTHIGHANLHRYYDTVEKKLCAVYGILDGYYNLHDVNEALTGEARMGLDILNTFRYANGLAPLYWDEAAAECSADHAAYMASIGELTHTGADGSGAIDRYLSYRPDFRWTAWGENICAEAKNIFTCMNGWRNSTIHRSLMLSDKLYAGIGLMYVPGGKYSYCAAMLLLK